MTDTPISVLVKCRRCQIPLTNTGPLCESCAAWLQHKADLIYSQAMVDAKVEKVWIMARMDTDAAVAAERERCAKVAEQAQSIIGASDGSSIAATCKMITAKIREGK
jgi:hypothetical protein